MQVERLDRYPDLLPLLAGLQFDHWSRLTGFDTVGEYRAALEEPGMARSRF